MVNIKYLNMIVLIVNYSDVKMVKMNKEFVHSGHLASAFLS